MGLNSDKAEVLSVGPGSALASGHVLVLGGVGSRGVLQDPALLLDPQEGM